MDKYTCEEFFRRLDDFLDRELSATETALMESHMQVCEACLKEYEFDSKVLEGVKSELRRVTPPAGFLARISEALANESGDP